MRELLVFTLEGQRYGIWKDEVQSIRDVSLLHRIPLSPPCIAGMSIIDDRTVTLADFAVCLGHAPASDKGKGRILLMPGKEKVAGFVVNGDLASLSISSDALYPMPSYLATPLIDTCAVHDGAPIPLINIAVLHQRVMAASPEPPQASLEAPGARPWNAADLGRIRLFVLGSELYGADGGGMAEQTIKPGPTSGLTALPRYIKGVTFYDGRILPVIDLAQRIKRQAVSGDPRMLLSEISEAWFGLLVEEDKGTTGAGACAIKRLPPIARTPWLQDAAVRDGAIIPLLDLPPLLTFRTNNEGDRPLSQRYTADSRFADLFGQGEVDVLEFALLGVRHALPKSEVEDIVDYKTCRELPGVPEIVIGVAEYNGELQPVLDLAMIFGRRSPVSPDWRMIAVKNGDFRALVITEAVYGERRLPRDIQRAVPIKLPQRVVYGCYPDADAVRLILNVEAIAVHFEKALVQELLPALSREMREAPAEVVASLLEEGPTIVAPREPTIPISPVVPPPTVEIPAAAAFAPPSAVGTPAEAEAGAAQGLTVEQAPVQGEEPAAAVSAQQAAEDHERLPEQAVTEESPPEVREEQKTAESAEVSPVTPEEAAPVEKEETLPSALPPAGVPAGEITVVEIPSAEQTIEERLGEGKALSGTPGVAEQTTVEGETAVVEENATEEAEPATVAAVEERAEAAARDKMPTLQQEPQAPIPVVEQASAFEARESIEEKTVKERTAEEIEAEVRTKASQREMASVLREGAKQPTHHLPSEYEETRRSWKRWLSYTALAAILIAFFYFLAGIPQRAGVEKPVKEAVPEKYESLLPEKPQRSGEERPVREAAPEKSVSLPAEKPRPSAKEPAPSLVLEIPAERPAAVDVYVVVKGDTLWHISKRFTGNPFNYPRIAGENRIANPDLIFPGQKIKLTQKAQTGR